MENFNENLKNNKKRIADKWFEAIINTYPKETARILVKSKNRFDNPVGVATMQCAEAVVDMLPGETDFEKVESELDSVIRIRAVQSFKPSNAIGFVFSLKGIVRDVLGSSFFNETADRKISESLDRKIDKIALAAFDRFMKCREDIFLLKATESKRRIHRAFERAGLIPELTEEELLGSSKS